jgi:hypothetical protein
VQESDAKGFDRALSRLCAGFDVPVTDARREAYWRAFRKLTVLEFAGLVDTALVESTFASMPTVGALRELHRKVQPPPAADAPTDGKSLQQQLCEYTLKQIGSRLSARELRGPWTYLYREWRDGDKRCAECTAVVIERDDGTRLKFSAADMRSDIGTSQLELT